MRDCFPTLEVPTAFSLFAYDSSKLFLVGRSLISSLEADVSAYSSQAMVSTVLKFLVLYASIEEVETATAWREKDSASAD